MMHDCDTARRHLGAVRDQEAVPDPVIDQHVHGCIDCRSWLADVDDVTRALMLRTVTQPTFVDAALEMWDARTRRTDDLRRAGGRILLGIAALGCLLVGGLIAADSAGHTHIGVTAQREVIILEIALALGLACAAVRPGIFLAGILPILGIVAVVNLAVSVVNLVTGNSTLLDEIAHLPFLLGLVGAYLVHRADPVLDSGHVSTHPVARA
jgi:predicted anti-sigma-YlaC factor YlaD